MSWSYDADPANNPIDAVRVLVGDTDPTAPLVNDEVISFFIGRTVTADAAAAEVAESLQAFYARKLDKVVGPIRVEYSKIYEHFKELALRLRSAATDSSTLIPSNLPLGPYDQLITRDGPIFTRHMQENPHNVYERGSGDFTRRYS